MSNGDTRMWNHYLVARKYEMRKRAEHVEETKRRIVEAAVELHQKVGPARTSLSSIAERAGVERQTYYRHFPDERALLSACSGLYMEQNPLPDPGPWRQIEDPERRLRHGLAEVYAYYEANEAMLSSVLRDAELHEATREVVTQRIGPGVAELGAALAAGWARGRKSRAAIDLAVGFQTWRSLARESGLSAEQAAELMARIVRCAG
jgi:AcrR family transcriptional regulator